MKITEKLSDEEQSSNNRDSGNSSGSPDNEETSLKLVQRQIEEYKQIILTRCRQVKPELLQKYYPASILRQFRRMHVGTFCHIYKWCTHNVFKPIPVKNLLDRRNDIMIPNYPRLINELRITLAMIILRDENHPLFHCKNFTDINGAYFTYGTFEDEQETCPFSLVRGELYLVLDLPYAGEMPRYFRFDNMNQCLSVVRQVVAALAVAERALKFEHRNLHWGNVLVDWSHDDAARYVLDGIRFEVKTEGVFATIIDFMLSRITINTEAIYYDPNQLMEWEQLYKGDPPFYNPHRDMAEAVGGAWESFKPITNIIWLKLFMNNICWERSYPFKYVDPDFQKAGAEIEKMRKDISSHSCVYDYAYELFDELKAAGKPTNILS